MSWGQGSKCSSSSHVNTQERECSLLLNGSQILKPDYLSRHKLPSHCVLLLIILCPLSGARQGLATSTL